MTNLKEIAAALHGMKYRSPISKDIREAAKNAKIVIVYGASDDLMEFDGAIRDEIGCYDGGSVFLDSGGLCRDFNELCESKDFEGLRKYFDGIGKRKMIEAIWGRDGISWQYETDVPHEIFDIMEDGEVYCRGIVFRLGDIA